MSGDNNRAAWAFAYEKGLADILKDHVNIPRFKGQNGWTQEGWRSIAQKFNEKFPLLHYTKQQIKEKEREFKGSYKVLRDARKNSGAGWDESIGMIIAEPKIWEKMIEDDPKVSKFKKKAFPLFNDCSFLYDGDLNFTSTQPPVTPAPFAVPALLAAPTPFAAPSGKEKKRREEQFFIEKCLDDLEALEGLTDEDKSYAMDVFDSERNREMFMKSRNHNARLIWLKRKIRLLSRNNE